MTEPLGRGPARKIPLPLSEADRVFGPVPSRRLGHSLGINAIPAKTCSYACVYCQAGRTTRLSIHRQAFVSPLDIIRQVGKRLDAAAQQGSPVEVLTLVPEGEATLDLELEATLVGLRRFGLPVAILTNASLITDPAVQRALAAADVVSLKVDAVDERIWHAVNRPHGGLSLPMILQEALAFSRRFSGRLLTETLLVRDLNDPEDHLQALAGYLALLDPDTAYLSGPIRPPAESWVRLASPSQMLRAHQILAGRVRRVEYLLGDEGTDFFAGDDPVRSLLGIAGVHPVRRAAALKILRPCGTPGAVLERLTAEGRLSAVRHRGRIFYLRTPIHPTPPPTAH